ncbi:LytR/AlgR family response regulator transcription factor [Flavobacterium acetivorans]|uniref:LytR/AlgR family response regulator transcription factor n=1 Tax=Flavobacterium acetivorans TaxID=2893883 RepID=UPI001E447529|nr:LytTR family DNA-binding domain-containing protein [Flavobacterium sp. F-29]UFH36100.1 LytTR family DNA-binding domain-containing protein [Flavobacterium sp. F-29]
MNYSYIIIDDDQESVLKTKAIADSFSELTFVASAHNYAEALNLILEHTPQLIFLEIDPADKKSLLSLALINELHRYLKVIPKIIVTTTKKELAFEAIEYDVTAYMLKPLVRIDFIKTILKLNKNANQEEAILIQPEEVFQEEKPNPVLHHETLSKQKPLILCIKSYGDYRYIDARDICYLQADNNSTDIHLNSGEMVTAFKTLKHFESALSYPFIRIHNSYIVNCNYISRIHTGNAVCYIKNTATKLPFSKSYKVNIDLIISEISNGNYLEI